MLKKMKTRKRLAAVITLITLFTFSSVMTVITAAQEASLVSATLATDKESYDEGENVGITLNVTNGNVYEIDKVKSVISPHYRQMYLRTRSYCPVQAEVLRQVRT